MLLASDLAMRVFPCPGTSSTRTCPSASSATTISSMAVFLPTMTEAMFLIRVSHGLKFMTDLLTHLI
jgi:hypothetical protein